MREMIKAISSSAKCHKDNPDNLRNIKKTLLKRQGGLCPITGRSLLAMSDLNVVVDHCHKFGHIRAVLPRAINGLEGKLTNLCVKWGSCSSPQEVIKMLRNMADYLEKHLTPQTEWIHPEHKNPYEKRILANKRARARYAKNKEKK